MTSWAVCSTAVLQPLPKKNYNFIFFFNIRTTPQLSFSAKSEVRCLRIFQLQAKNYSRHFYFVFPNRFLSLFRTEKTRTRTSAAIPSTYLWLCQSNEPCCHQLHFVLLALLVVLSTTRTTATTLIKCYHQRILKSRINNQILASSIVIRT